MYLYAPILEGCYEKTQEVIHVRRKLDGMRCCTHLRLRSSEVRCIRMITGTRWLTLTPGQWLTAVQFSEYAVMYLSGALYRVPVRRYLLT
jgi:hypothetical protein